MPMIKLPVASALVLGTLTLPALAQDNPLEK